MFGILRLLSVKLAYLFEIDRLQDLATAVGISSAAVGLGYQYVNRGELAPGMQAEQLLRTRGGGSEIGDD